ncbi:MAG: apolipoprotein N-acyltransferase [Myxococcales bacterium]|jgi:apolipoprotein N-acyltransferase|nr:apolipoprotein N-acyltransferase [Myxococcales bacterium]
MTRARTTWTALALATLSGVLYFVGFVDFGIWPIAWICLAPLLWALRSAPTGKRAFLLSWWMGTATFLGGYYWLIHLFQTFASFSWPIAFLLYVGFCALQGLQFGVFGTLTWKLSRGTGLSMGWIAPVALVAAEFVIPLFFQSYLANSLAYVPWLTQVADLGGVLLVSFIMAAMSGALFEVIAARVERRPFPKAIALTAMALLAFDVGYSALRIRQMEARDAAAPQVTTAIIQANVGAGDKHLHTSEGIARYREMTDAAMEARPDLGLVVWPESAYNRVVMGRPNLAGHIARQVRVPMIVGLVRTERDRPGAWNSVAAVAPGGDIEAFYDKVELLAFGEYIPGEKLLKPLYDRVLPFSSAFRRGDRFESLPVGPWRLSVDVCYEDILPRHIRALMRASVEADAQGRAPNAMVNVTNDSWYGPAEPPIHLALAVFRAIEHRRWMIRATATGISAFIDSSGRLVQHSGFETAETLIQPVPMIEAGPTIYGRVGDVLGWLCALAIVAVLIGRSRLGAALSSLTGRRAPKG